MLSLKKVLSIIAAAALLGYEQTAPQEDLMSKQAVPPVNNSIANDVITEKDSSTVTSYNFECTSKAAIKTSKANTDSNLIPFTNYSFDCGKDTLITTASGSVINVKANSFLKADNSIVEGNIKLKFREIRGGLDIALSGIPMNLGDTALLLSGGMFEVRATQNKEELKLDSNKPLVVDLTTNVKSQHFNHYQLDDITNTWVDKGDLNIDTTNKLQAIENELKWWEFTDEFENSNGYFNAGKKTVTLAVRKHEIAGFNRWYQSRRKKPSNNTFYTIFSKKHFPQNSNLKYLAWHISDNNAQSEIDKFMLLHQAENNSNHSFWNDLNIVRCGTEFTLHFSNKNEHLILNVVPNKNRFPGVNRFAKKEKLLDQRLIRKVIYAQKRLKHEGSNEISAQTSALSYEQMKDFILKNAIYPKRIASVIGGAPQRIPHPKYKNTAKITIVDMGVHNIDAPIDYIAFGALNLATSPIQLAFSIREKILKKRFARNKRSGHAIVLDEPNNNSSVAKIVLIQKGINTTQTFANADLRKFSFFKNHNNLGIVFLKNGTFRVIDPESFKKTKVDDVFFHFESAIAMNTTELKTIVKDSGFTY